MKRIAIVEDDPLIARIYEGRLRLEGFDVVTFGDGQAAVDWLRQNRPDLLLLDLQLPKLSGVEVLRFARSQSHTVATPVIVLTNSFLGKSVESAWKAGANHCLTKAENTPRQVIDLAREIIAGHRDTQRQTNPAVEPPLPTAPKDCTVGTLESVERELRDSFFRAGPVTVTKCREAAFRSIQTDDLQVKLQALLELCRLISPVAAKLQMTAHLTDGLLALLRDLVAHPGHLNPSTVRTVAQTIELISTLLKHVECPEPPIETQLDTCRTLVVDDEPISRRVIVKALDEARLQSADFESPELAWQAAQRELFHLVVTDIDMPKLNGFELCQRLRMSVKYKSIPVIFVTNFHGFENRKNAAISGGDDLIAKPFPRLELTVKALFHLVRSQFIEPTNS